MHVADLHNFGQQVKRVARASGICFQKPRTLFWEWLFFGATSPLRSVIDDGSSDGPLSEIFGLEVEFSGPNFTGAVREVEEWPGGIVERDDSFYRFGALLAYCYAFGIRDLHRSNVVPTPHGLQVIDAEVVFTRLLLPSETLLLPFKDVPFDRSGLSHLVGDLSDLTVNDVQALLSGYVECLMHLVDRADAVFDAISRAAQCRSDILVRHIARDTKGYRDWKTRQIGEHVPYIPEELIQLERGDIPYFFKFLGKPELWYYTSSDGSRAQVKIPTYFVDAVERDATSPSLLLDRARLLGDLFPVGTLFLARKLIPEAWEGRLSLRRGISLSCTSTRFELKSPSSSYGAVRHRKVVESPALAE